MLTEPTHHARSARFITMGPSRANSRYLVPLENKVGVKKSHLQKEKNINETDTQSNQALLNATKRTQFQGNSCGEGASKLTDLRW